MSSGPDSRLNNADALYGSIDDRNGSTTYETLYDELSKVRSTRGFRDWFSKAMGMIFGTMVVTVLIAVLNAVPIYMIVVGSLNVGNCPVQRHIPIWLIVAGAFTIVKSIIFLLNRLIKSSKDGEESGSCCRRFDKLLSCFLLAWLIVGSVWVYKVFQPDYIGVDRYHYCDQLTYLSAFVIITCTYGLTIMIVLFGCCCFCTAICCMLNYEHPGA